MKNKQNCKLIRNIKNIVIISIFLFSCFILFVLYGPYPGFRNYLITSSLSTMSHKYIANILYSERTIKKVLDDNYIIDSNEISDSSLIDINIKKERKIFKNKYDKQLLNRNNNQLYKVISIRGKTYNGFLVAIYDPSKVSLVTSKNIGTSGEKITSVSKRNKAVVAINGGGFYDPNWASNGAKPHGVVIKDGKVISSYDRANMGGGFIGFTYDDKLILGKMSEKRALKVGYRDAMEFGPYLIINGKKSLIKGNGGFGIAPRSAIGQRKDGIVLLLAINGRIPTSIGADMNDLCEIMTNYGALNAANLDGGSSTELLVNNKIINTPVAGSRDGLRKMPIFWIVKK